MAWIKYTTAVVTMLLFATSLTAQVNQGSILGTVRDQSGGSIPGATVTVTDTLKGISRTLTTDDAGEYSAPNLDPSTYRIRVEFKGFKTLDREGLQVGVGQEAKVDIILQPGEQNQTVTVTEAIPLVETTSATLTGNINTDTITDIPLNGRNYINLLTLRPGYINLPGGGGGNQTAMGLRPGDNFFIVDGLNDYEWNQGQQVINGFGLAGDAGTLLPIDAIQEFNIQQNPQAEFGWKPGLQINIGLKSGTNNIHGTAFAFGRDGSWDALNFFQPTTLAKPPLEFYQYGATVGGPIKKDKIFWFLAFESQQLDLGITTPISTPTDVAGGGTHVSMVDACNAVNAAHAADPVNNLPVSALSATLAGLNPATCAVTAPSASFENVFVTNRGNQFPGMPNEVVPSGLASLSDVNSSYNGLAKVDYHINDRHTLSGMFFIGQTVGTWDDNPSVIVSQWWRSYLPIQNRVGSGSWTWVPNSSYVNELKVGYTHEYQPFLSADHAVNPNLPWGLDSSGLPTGYAVNSGVTDPSFYGFMRMSLQGFTLMGGNWPKFIGPNANTEFLDHISYLHGKHSFKFGGETTFVSVVGGATTNAKGRVNFKNNQYGTLVNPNPTSIENYLTGNVDSQDSSQIFVGDPVRYLHNEQYALFFQDDYRVTPGITLNFGLRYELATVIQEANNEIGSFNPNSPNGFVQVGVGLTSPYNGNHHNFSPRLGIAWDVKGNQKTVIRAGVSLLYEFVPYSAFMQLGGNAVGLGKVPTGALICTGTPAVCTPGNGTIAAATVTPTAASLSSGWQNNGPNTPIFQTSTIMCTDSAPCSTAAIERNLNVPYVETWNISIQHSFTNNLSLEVAYIGNHGTKLYGTTDLNAPPVGAGWGNPSVMGTPAQKCIASANDMTAGKPTPYDHCASNPALELGPYSPKYPYISYIDYLSNIYGSHYNAAQVTLTQRTSHGLSFTAAYTYSHALDDVSQNFGSTIPLNNSNPSGSMYGSSDYDIRNRFTFELTYMFPGKKSPGQMLEGWQVSSAVTAQSATPWAVQDLSNDFSGTGEVNNPNPWGEAWDFIGKPKEFTASPNGLPYFGGGASVAPGTPGFTAATPTLNATCNAAATAMGTLALASLWNNGCYANGGSVLIPPPYGQYGTIGRNIFRDTPFRTWDLSLQKNWKFKEKLTAQFRAEFFNILNHPVFGDVGSGHLANNDPSVGGTPFAAANETPDQASGNPVLGSGSNRDIQLGLKLIF